MNGIESPKQNEEYRNIPIAQLKESATNPRKTFDQGPLEELAESIRVKGVLSPLLVRPVDGRFEIVAGERRFRAARLAGRDTVPATVRELSDAECLEIQLIENLLRTDLHPFEEARGFRALLKTEGGGYTIEEIAAKTGKPASFIAKRLKLLDLVKAAADAFLAGQIGVEHAQLIAKLAPDMQEGALHHCFDGFYAADDRERSLVPVSRLQAWIEHNIYLSLKSVPFSKDDETLLPEAGSCANCPKRTGFNTLLFSEVREDSCSDAACFNRKLDAHIARRVAKTPGLVVVSESYNLPSGTAFLSRQSYVEVVEKKSRNGREARRGQRLCNRLATAIRADGVDKGRLLKVCADPNCKIHFGDRHQEEKRRLEWIEERKAANRNAKQTVNLRHRILAEVLKRVKAPLAGDALRLIARFVLVSLSHDLACRLAKRHGLEPAKKGQDWELADEVRLLYKTADGTTLAALIFEAMLLAVAGNSSETKDDLLTESAKVYKVDVRALRTEVAKAEKEKEKRKKMGKPRKNKNSAKSS
jgi:ParB family transcriptional regulator, chromosome partitioning protein